MLSPLSDKAQQNNETQNSSWVSVVHKCTIVCAIVTLTHLSSSAIVKIRPSQQNNIVSETITTVKNATGGLGSKSYSNSISQPHSNHSASAFTRAKAASSGFSTQQKFNDPPDPDMPNDAEVLGIPTTGAPTTPIPTAPPTTQLPTNSPNGDPTTPIPTTPPMTQLPTNSPTGDPTTSIPTEPPTTQLPTGAPTLQQPSSWPTMKSPTNPPTKNSGNSEMEFPSPNNTYYDRMVRLDPAMVRSADHQRKFLARKDKVKLVIPEKQLFFADTQKYAAFAISDSFAFLHIWKCGGTTIEKMGVRQMRRSEVQNRAWIGLVRDPVDHFLSGWAEVGMRWYDAARHPNPEDVDWLAGDYDSRIRHFLQHDVMNSIYPEYDVGSIVMHAHPQANFLMNGHGLVDDHVKVVGDLSEMKTVLEEVGEFDGWIDHVTGRNASANEIKGQYFPNRRDLLSDTTTLSLCNFLRLDYFLFNFEPPKICIQEGGPFHKWWGKDL